MRDTKQERVSAMFEFVKRDEQKYKEWLKMAEALGLELVIE